MYTLLLMLNMVPWAGLSGLFVELPLLVNRLPETWDLPSYFVVIRSGASVVSFVYALFVLCYKEPIPESRLVLLLVVFSIAAPLCMAYVWDISIVIGERRHSLPLFLVVGITSIFATLSRVVFLPYMGNFSSVYISASTAGMAMSRALLGFLGLLQGLEEHRVCMNQTSAMENGWNRINESEEVQTHTTAIYPEPNFSVRTFFIIVSIQASLCGMSFFFLQYHPYCTKRRQATFNETEKKARGEDEVPLMKRSTEQPESSKETSCTVGDHGENSEGLMTGEDLNKMSEDKKTISLGCIRLCLLVSWNVSLMYVVTPTVSPYALLPYGNRAYNLAIKIGLASSPVSALMTLFLHPRSTIVLGILQAVPTLCTAYLVILASFSPHPPLQGTAEGEALAVSTNMGRGAFQPLVGKISNRCTKEVKGPENGSLP